MWYAVSLDECICFGRTYAHVREEVLSHCDDGRKHPDIKRKRPGLYEYNQSTRYATTHRAHFYIGTKQALLQAGFDETLFNQ